jgi:hypothetical protein
MISKIVKWPLSGLRQARRGTQRDGDIIGEKFLQQSLKLHRHPIVHSFFSLCFILNFFVEKVFLYITAT